MSRRSAREPSGARALSTVIAGSEATKQSTLPLRRHGLLRFARNDGTGIFHSHRKALAMASIHKDILIDANPNDVWDALRDLGALHTRLVPGFVTDTKLDGDARIVTFANGTV